MASSYAFSWDSAPLGWPAELGATWMDKKYKTPRPCRSGAACVWVDPTGERVCSGVHPGEEGLYLKYFPARSVRDESSGSQRWEPATIRLVGDGEDRETRARFYERRRLRLSWPDWCAQQGLSSPAAVAAGAAGTGRRKERIQLDSGFGAFPASSPPAFAAVPVARPRTPPPEPRPSAEELAAMAAAEQRRQAVRYQQQLAMAAAEQQARLWLQYQEMMRQQQALMQLQLQKAQQQLPQDLARDPRLSTVQRKNVLGERIYPLVKAALDKSAADREVLGLAHPTITAGKITGMWLEGYSTDELLELESDDAIFSPALMEACTVLIEDAKLRERDPLVGGMVASARRDAAGQLHPPADPEPRISEHAPSAAAVRDLMSAFQNPETLPPAIRRELSVA